MKFRKSLVALVGTCVLCISNALMLPALADDEPPEFNAYVKVKSSLRVRSGPSISYDIIDKLNPGDLINVEESLDNGWAKVTLQDGSNGYVSSEYIVIPDKDYQYELVSVAVITSSSSKNRDFNMAKACEAINGMVLQPGDEFNWYGDKNTKAVVGPANKKNGYKKATVISGGKYVPGYGGGVCQVSTAVFNCIHKLDIVPTERHNHSLRTSYVEEGMDATVAYPSKNFVFSNTKEYAILFEAYTDGGQVVIAAYKDRS